MDLTQFRASVAQSVPPEGMSLALQTLWWDAKGDWNRAHECAQQDEGNTGSAVHAYLHRKEGDMRNAGGWYSARRPRTGHGVARRRMALAGRGNARCHGNREGVMDADAKKTTLRMIPYGLYVLTADDGKGTVGAATVNWVTQTAFAPPTRGRRRESR